VGIGVSREPREISLADAALFQVHVLFMHGRSSFELTSHERAQLQEYLQRGGTLLADAICSSQAFSQSFRREMAAVFPQSKLVTIPGDDPILTSAFGGSDVTRVTRRDLKSVLRGSPATLTSGPSPQNLKRSAWATATRLFSRRWISAARWKRSLWVVPATFVTTLCKLP
jgi:hypothetical protein